MASIGIEGRGQVIFRRFRSELVDFSATLATSRGSHYRCPDAPKQRSWFSGTVASVLPIAGPIAMLLALTILQLRWSAPGLLLRPATHELKGEIVVVPMFTVPQLTCLGSWFCLPIRA